MLQRKTDTRLVGRPCAKTVQKLIKSVIFHSKKLMYIHYKWSLIVLFSSKKTQKSIKLSKARDYFRRDEPEKKTIISGHEETRKGPGKMGSPMRLPFHCSWLVVSIVFKRFLFPKNGKSRKPWNFNTRNVLIWMIWGYLPSRKPQLDWFHEFQQSWSSRATATNINPSSHRVWNLTCTNWRWVSKKVGCPRNRLLD